MKHFTKVAGRLIVNQNPEFANIKRADIRVNLPVLLRVITAVEQATGHKWKITSYLRDSPSHRRAEAIDIAPDVANSALPFYAVYKHSDPVLYKRAPLIRSLQHLATSVQPDKFDVGIFIEPDHLHIQLFIPETSPPRIRVFKWKLQKDVYRDSAQRMTLPMTEAGYS